MSSATQAGAADARPVAVVTGGTRGIGREIADRLAESGHRVIAIARTARGDEPFEVWPCDLADASAVVDVFAQLPPVDVLVCSAGVSMSAKVEATALSDWDTAMAVNARAVFLGVQAVLPAMRQRGMGRIVAIASTASVEGAPYVAAYTASKHAVLGFMRVLAAELAGSSVAAATVCPTFVRTEMTFASIRRIAERTGCSLDEAEARLAALTPHGRLVEPDEVAERVLDLLQRPVDAMNGAVEVVDG